MIKKFESFNNDDKIEELKDIFNHIDLSYPCYIEYEKLEIVSRSRRRNWCTKYDLDNKVIEISIYFSSYPDLSFGLDLYKTIKRTLLEGYRFRYMRIYTNLDLNSPGRHKIRSVNLTDLENIISSIHSIDGNPLFSDLELVIQLFDSPESNLK